jgi:hypothetical protein
MKFSESQERIWEGLYPKIRHLLGQYGKEDHLGRGDFWVLSDNYGARANKVYLNNLKLLQPAIISSLQQLIAKVADWEIVVSIDIPGNEERWPDMGLTIRPSQIVDDLQRQFLPADASGIDFSFSNN